MLVFEIYPAAIICGLRTVFFPPFFHVQWKLLVLLFFRSNAPLTQQQHKICLVPHLFNMPIKLKIYFNFSPFLLNSCLFTWCELFGKVKLNRNNFYWCCSVGFDDVKNQSEICFADPPIDSWKSRLKLMWNVWNEKKKKKMKMSENRTNATFYKVLSF